MKLIFKIAFLLLWVNLVNAQVPAGAPTVNAPSGWYSVGWLQGKNGLIFAVRDTNFLPSQPGTAVMWQRPGVDTTLWIWTGQRPWKRITQGGDVSSITASGGVERVGNDIRLGGTLPGVAAIDGQNTGYFSMGNMFGIDFYGVTTGADGWSISANSTDMRLFWERDNATREIAMNVPAGGMILNVNGKSGFGNGASFKLDTLGRFYMLGLKPVLPNVADSILTIASDGQLKFRTPSSFGFASSASNGLTKVLNDIQWGGALTANTTISGAFTASFTNTRLIANRIYSNGNRTPPNTTYGGNMTSPPGLVVYDTTRGTMSLETAAVGGVLGINFAKQNSTRKVGTSFFSNNTIAYMQVSETTASGTLWQWYIASDDRRSSNGSITGGGEPFTIGPQGSGNWGVNYAPTASANTAFKSGPFARSAEGVLDGPWCQDNSLFQVNAGGLYMNFQNVAVRGAWQADDSLLIVTNSGPGATNNGRTYKGTPFEGTAGFIQKANSRKAMDNTVIFQDASSNIGIGTTTPAATALLDITSTTKGLLIPRLNTTQQNAIVSPATSLLIYNLDSSAFRYYNGSVWVTIGANTGGGGGSGTVTNFIFTDGSGFDGTVTASTTTPTLSLTTTLTTGSVPVIGASGALSQDNANLYFASGQLGVGTNSPASRLNVQTNNLGSYTTTTTQNTSGIIVNNTTAAANGAQQASPRFIIEGQGWGTTAGSSQSVKWAFLNLPVQGTVPTSNLRLQVSINNGTYTEPYTFSSGGMLGLTDLSATGFVQAGSASSILWATRSRMTSPANGSILLANNANNDFSQLQFGGTTSSFPSLQRSTTNLIARLADNSANTDIEVLDEAYGVSWNGSNEVPTKNAVYDKIETIGGTTLYTGDGSISSNRTVTSTSSARITFEAFPYFNLNGSTLLNFTTTSVSVAQGIAKAIGTNNMILGPNHGGTYDKGSVQIDTNTNLLVGGPATDMPLYATGNSLYTAAGFQSRAGNFYKSRTITSSTSALLTDYWINIDASGGSITITLPAASSAFGGTMGIQYVFNRVDNVVANSVTIQRAGSDTINGTTNFTLDTQWAVKETQCTSTSTWNIK